MLKNIEAIICFILFLINVSYYFPTNHIIFPPILDIIFPPILQSFLWHLYDVRPYGSYMK